MANATKGTLFRQRLDNVLQSMVQKAERLEVVTLPASTREATRKNAQLLEMCSADLDEDQRALVLQIFNTDWDEQMSSTDHIKHICEPGCCSSMGVFRRRVKEALDALFGHLFPVPLLYRWKGFDEACAWTARGLLLKGLLRVIWALCKSDSADHPEMLALDEDNPDMNPSLQQQVRVAKVMQLLSEPDSTDYLLQWYSLSFVGQPNP